MPSTTAMPSTAAVSSPALPSLPSAPASAVSNVVRFPGTHRSASPRGDQKSFMDAVYTSGAMPVSADDRATKAIAMRLQIFGFVTIEEVQLDGSARRLRPSEAVQASTARPWRVSKASGWAGGAAPVRTAGSPIAAFMPA